MHVDFYLADQNPHRDRSLGITAYTCGLLEELGRLDGLTLFALVSFFLFPPPQAVGDPFAPVPNRSCRGAAGSRSHPEPLSAPAAADVIHYPKGFLPMIGKARRPRVGTIHHTIVAYYAAHPGYRSSQLNAYWCFLLGRSLTRLDLVLTDSLFSRQAIAAFCDERSISPPRIEVTYLGAKWEALASGQLSTARKGSYAIHLASQLPHKNTHALLLWQRYQERGGEVPRLLLVGSLTPEAEGLARAVPGVETGAARRYVS